MGFLNKFRRCAIFFALFAQYGSLFAVIFAFKIL